MNNLKYSDVELTDKVFTNVIKMLIERKYIEDNFNKHYKKIKQDIKKSMESTNYILCSLSLKDTSTKINIILLQKLITASVLLKDIDFNNSDKYIIITSEIKNLKQLLNRSNIEIFQTSYFYINIIEHKLIPKHIPCTDEEKEKILKELDIELDNLPKMCHDDPIVRYYNVNVNDVIKIIRYSELSGISIIYRVVKKYKIGTESSK